MDEKLKIKLKEKFKDGKYDVFPYIVENDLLLVDLSNYKNISVELINLLNEVRKERYIEDQENFQLKEDIFANNYYETVYNAIKRHENIEELEKEDLEELKKYYHMLKSVSLIGVTYKEDQENISLKK